MKQHFAITAQQVVQDCETREEETNEVKPTQVLKLAPKAVPGYRRGRGKPNKSTHLTELKRNSWNVGRTRQVGLVGQSIRL